MLQTPEEEGLNWSRKQENDELLKRIADVQQEKWTLEEKVLSPCFCSSCFSEGGVRARCAKNGGFTLT